MKDVNQYTDVLIRMYGLAPPTTYEIVTTHMIQINKQ